MFDYRLDESSNSSNAAGSGGGWAPAQAGSGTRRSGLASDGGMSGGKPDAANNVVSSSGRKPQVGGDDDAGADISTDNPTDVAPPASEAQSQAGWAALSDWTALPTFTDSQRQLFSTHERGEGSFPLIDPGNKDFSSFLAICGAMPELVGQQNDASVMCEPGESGYLVAADDGPGYISRILLARGISNPSSSVLVDLRPTTERIRIYIDGEANPVFEGLWSDWANQLTAPFNAPLAGWTSGGLVSYVPISYSKRLRVFVDELTSSSFTLYYVHVDTHRVSATAPFNASAIAAPDARAELDALVAGTTSASTTWFDQSVDLPGAGAWNVWTRAEPGTVQRLELQLERATADALLNETSLHLYWDDAALAVDLPLSLLFGARHGLAPFSTWPLSVQVDDSTVLLTLNLPMPFAQSARLELVHATEYARNMRVRISGSDALPRGEWGFLRSDVAEHSRPMQGERFQVAALSGRGKYLGTLMYMRGKADASRSVRAEELGFLEGDERLVIDGQVSALGTGTDNYFNGGFYFKDGLYNSAFSAVSQLAVDETAMTSEATMMRWTILGDAIDFQSQLDLSFEFGADRAATVRDYAAVSFFYQ